MAGKFRACLQRRNLADVKLQRTVSPTWRRDRFQYCFLCPYYKQHMSHCLDCVKSLVNGSVRVCVLIQQCAWGKNCNHFCHLKKTTKHIRPTWQRRSISYTTAKAMDFPLVESCSNKQSGEWLQTSITTENTIGLQMILQQEKSTKSLDNLLAAKCWIPLTWRTGNTNEMCHPKLEKCLHHAADGLKQRAGFQEADAERRSCFSKGAFNTRLECSDISH